MSRIQLKKQLGASLLEVIAYLGIAAIVVIGAVGLLSRAFGSSASNQALEQINAVRVNLKKLYSGSPYGTANNTNVWPALISVGAIPPGLTNTAGAITNAWNGAVTLVSAGGNTVATVVGSNSQFLLTYNNVPTDACVDILTSIPAGSTWASVQINGGGAGLNFISSSAAGAATAFPVSGTSAATACNAAGNANVMKFLSFN